jgi:hypothetical protein
MSFEVGKDSFNPPPPPKKRMSPWAMTGIGCAVLLVGSIAGLGTCAVQMSKVMKEELKKPIDKEQVLAQLGDTPLYPKIQFDEALSKLGRAGLKFGGRFVPAERTVAGGFRTDDAPSLVYAWYDEQLIKAGYVLEDKRSGKQEGHTYRKDHDMIVVHVNPDKGEANQLMVMRFYNVKKK